MGLSDSLTGLLNRDGFKKAISAAIFQKKEFNVVCLNLKKFRKINAFWGHAVGDLVLKIISSRIIQCLGKTQYVARFDRDDFSFLIMRDVNDAITKCNSLISKIQKTIRIGRDRLNVHVCIGICNYPNQSIEIEELIDKANIALRIAKNSHSRTALHFSEDMIHSEKLVDFYNTKDISIDEITLGSYTVYQPLFCVKSKRICSLEVLLRHPDRLTSDIITWAEEYGYMNDIFKITVMNAVRVIIKTGLPVSVNLSPSQMVFDGKWLISFLSNIISKNNLPKYSLNIEITEAIQIGDRDILKETALRIRELGVQIYLDDFGAGYSFVSVLSLGVFDFIKLDRVLVNGIQDSPSAQNLVHLILNYAKSKSMSVVAEGVEHEDEVQTLYKIGINYIQGYVFSKPLTEIDMFNYLKLHNA